ncbi:MAG: hypothetical protein ACRDTP_10220, partial [Mycobacteriales bacterium]
ATRLLTPAPVRRPRGPAAADVRVPAWLLPYLPGVGEETVGDTWYVRLLRLRSVHPGFWTETLYVYGSALVGVVLYLADLATAWTILVLPLAVAATVKVYDTVVSARPDGPED